MRDIDTKPAYLQNQQFAKAMIKKGWGKHIIAYEGAWLWRGYGIMCCKADEENSDMPTIKQVKKATQVRLQSAETNNGLVAYPVEGVCRNFLDIFKHTIKIYKEHGVWTDE